ALTGLTVNGAAAINGAVTGVTTLTATSLALSSFAVMQGDSGAILKVRSGGSAVCLVHHQGVGDVSLGYSGFNVASEYYILNAAGVGMVKINAAGAFILGPDIGGSEIMRVNGNIRANALICSTTINAGSMVGIGQTSFPTLTSGQGTAYGASTLGLILAGYGSTYDVTLVSRAGAVMAGFTSAGAMTLTGKISANGAAASSTLTGYSVAQVITWLQSVFA
ncbi:MAG: hypothetical protein ACRDBH_07200, partial [Bosea sp. (in: a-proteobacteria)]